MNNDDLKEYLTDCILNEDNYDELMDAINRVFEDAQQNSVTETEQTVLITVEEYNSLCEDSEFLSCLRANGVDNWSGYDDAQEMMSEEEC